MKSLVAPDPGDTRRTALRWGYIAAGVACAANTGYCIAQILQLLHMVTSPLDALLIYGFSFCIAIPFLLAMVALHYSAPSGTTIYTHTAMLFALIYVVYVLLNYTVQLTAVVPYANPDPVLVQSPHSLCWTLDALGYIFMGLATWVIIPVFKNKGYQKWLRGFLIANTLMIPVISVVYFAPRFSEALLMLASPWMITTTGSLLLLAIFFYRQRKLHDHVAHVS